MTAWCAEFLEDGTPVRPVPAPPMSFGDQAATRGGFDTLADAYRMAELWAGITGYRYRVKYDGGSGWSATELDTLLDLVLPPRTSSPGVG